MSNAFDEWLDQEALSVPDTHPAKRGWEACAAYAAQCVRWAPSSAHWSNELKKLCGDDASTGIAKLEQRLQECREVRDDLQEALQDFVDQYGCYCGHPACNDCERTRLGHAALAKAKGEA